MKNVMKLGICSCKFPGRNYIRPPPPTPISGHKAFFRGGGVGVYILRPHAAGILYAPPFYTPPTPRRVFSGVGGWVYKIRPRSKTSREKRREKFVVKNSGHFRASFPKERGEAKFHLKFHGIFHGNFHALFQEKISRQHFCTTCRDEMSGVIGMLTFEWRDPMKSFLEGPHFLHLQLRDAAIGLRWASAALADLSRQGAVIQKYTCKAPIATPTLRSKKTSK